MSGETYRATGFLIMEPTRLKWSPENVSGCKIAGIKQKRPTSLPNGSVAVAVTIEIPKAAFEPLRPAALIVVPEELIQHEVTVEATE